MRLIFRYIKPYMLAVLAVFVLTFAQVQTELSLPDMMSGIVTDGIQYGGITDDKPVVLTAKDLEEIALFMNEEDKAVFLSAYDKVPAGEKITVAGQKIVAPEGIYRYNGRTEAGPLLEMPLVYDYLADRNGIAVTEENAPTVVEQLKQQLESLEDNHASLVRIHIRDLYEHAGLSPAGLQNSYILNNGLKMLGIAALGVLIQLLATYLATRTAARTAADLRGDVFRKVESFSSSEFSRFSTASLITRSGNDITKIQQLIQMMLRMMLMSPIMGITAVFKVIRYPGISWLLIVAIGIIVCAMIVLAVFAVPKFEVIQKLTDKINSLMREFLDGMLVIRAFNSQKIEEAKFTATNKEYSKTELFVSRMMNIMGPVMTFVMNGLMVMIIWFSASQIDIDAMTIGDMMAFSQYAMHVVMSFMMVTMMFFMIPRSLVSVRRVKEILDTRNTILDPEEPLVLPAENGQLVFDDVSFRYPGAEEAVLEHISFTADPGETVAFIGSTGSGKSTIVKLIPRLFDVSEGKISYCGIDVREVEQRKLREKIGLASQKAVLFTGDIRSNISFGREVDEAKLQEAIEVSQSSDIVAAKEEGLAAPITQGGTNVSGGQKQRLSIARALAQDKNIYIFDDCFSALDFATDKKLRAALKKLIDRNKATLIMVAQRISTIRNADKIIVLDQGKIVGQGKHEELLKECEVYKQIAYSQLSQEELA